MTCYLEYRKEGGREILEGTYTSRNMNNGTDCGGGKVFLEKVPDSDFEKEDFLKELDKKDSGKGKVKPGQEEFLVNKPATAPAKTEPSKTTVQKTAPAKPKTTTSKATPKPGTAKKPVTPPVAKTTAPKTTTTPVKPQTSTTTKPAATAKATQPAQKKTDSVKTNAPATTVKTAPASPVPSTKPATVKLPTPAVLKQRQNELFQTISTSARQITISFYDNGEIDGDTISVYDNNRLLVRNRGLSANPITVTVQLDEDENEHEIIMVAENLGSIPPNTALMIVQAGDDRYTLRLSSTEQKNAMVRFRYAPAAAGQ
jgi:outer membrane biosynthesis protein TonB